MRTLSKIVTVFLIPFLIGAILCFAEEPKGKKVDIGPKTVNKELYVDLTKQPVNLELICKVMKQTAVGKLHGEWFETLPTGVVVVLIHRFTEEKFILQPDKEGKIELQLMRGPYFAKICKYTGWETKDGVFEITDLNETTKTILVHENNQSFTLRLIEE